MRSCYVAMPYGIKTRADGGQQDFEFLFQEGITPVISEAGLVCRRYVDFETTFWRRSVFTEIISCDVMIADISTGNPNVFYELGVRHALKRGRTITISASGGRPPFDIQSMNVLTYDIESSGRPSDQALAQFRAQLLAMLRQSARSTISDSPVYDIFPELEVLLPPELAGSASPSKSTARFARSSDTRTFAQAAFESPGQVVDDLKKSEQAVRNAPNSDPIELLTLLRRYRDLSEWNSVIELARDAPPASQSPEVKQIWALALNRRNEGDDQERAIALMQGLVAETGGDGETFGILGRIYKDRYVNAVDNDRSSEAADYLEQALQSYRKGYHRSRDIYSGVNIVALLQERNDTAAKAELVDLVPQIRAIVHDRIENGRDSGRVDYWDLATEVDLAVAARDWPAAAETAEILSQTKAPAWMIETTLQPLLRALPRMIDPADKSRLEQIIGTLKRAIEAA